MNFWKKNLFHYTRSFMKGKGSFGVARALETNSSLETLPKALR